MADQESLDYFAHYDPVSGEIVEPLANLDLDTLNVREITCFRINLDEIVDADEDIENGITVEGDLFLSDTSTAQFATVQGVAGAEIDFLDNIAFDTGSGVKFGLGDVLDDYLSGTFPITITGAITTSDTCKYVKIGDKVTIQFPTISGTTSAGNQIAAAGLPSNIRPASGADFTVPVFVIDNNVLVLGQAAVTAGGSVIFGVGATSANFSGPAASGFSATTITYTVL